MSYLPTRRVDVEEPRPPPPRQDAASWPDDTVPVVVVAVVVEKTAPVALTQRLRVTTVPLPHTPRPHDWFILEPLPCVPFNAD